MTFKEEMELREKLHRVEQDAAYAIVVHVALEREACAELAEQYCCTGCRDREEFAYRARQEIAAAIRKRGEDK